MASDILKFLKVSDNKRFLVDEDGSPFFWLADTAWELFHKLNREDALLYLRDRMQKRFTVIQAVALMESDDLDAGNAYGRKPFLRNAGGQIDPTLPDINGDKGSGYWDDVDFVLGAAADLGLYVAFLPAWGDKFNCLGGKGPEIFNEDNAYIYGQWLGKRYQNRTNIIWVLGGDRLLSTSAHFAVVNAMAHGLREGDGGRHIMTFHPYGGYSSTYHFHSVDWMDFNMLQSGHGAWNLDNYNRVQEDYERLPAKPVVDGEPRYEDHPVGFNPGNGYFDDFDVRQAAYWAVFAGAFGHTYGHHSIWSMCTERSDYYIMHWKDALQRPGGGQMRHLRSLMESRPFLQKVPDQSLIAANYRGAGHLQATRGGDYVFIYSPVGLNINVHMGKISGDNVKAHWLNPRTGEAHFIGVFANAGDREFEPPSTGRNEDWVLVLDDISAHYSFPACQ